MNTASILIKTDPLLKIRAQKTAEKLGLSLTSIINNYLKHFITAETITFNARDEIPNSHTARLLKQSEEEVKAGKVIRFDNPDDALAYLDRMIERDRIRTQTNN